MAIEAKEIVGYIRVGFIFAIRTSYRSARAHPFIWGILFFLVLLYRSFPSFFALLISSSPVIACTTLLLGLLLSYGEPNLPEIDEEEEDKTTQQVSSLKFEVPADDLVVKRDESLAVDAHLESSSGEEDEKDVDSDDDEVVEREVQDHGFVVEREFFVEKEAEIEVEVSRDVSALAFDHEENIMDSLKVKIGNPALEENHFDSSLGSPWLPVNTHDGSSDSESDGAESSSPDASLADIIPMLDELHPLLDSGSLLPAVRSMDDSDEGSVEEEGEHQVEDDDDEKTHEGEKHDGNGEAVNLTADDQRNAMDLGISDIERNRRLESLIAKRRARRDLRSFHERNLIDFDHVPAMDDLSHLQVRIPPISAPRKNPFDLPDESEGTMGLPPIPLSAPSVMQPRQNPFDLTFDQVGHSSGLTTESLSHGSFNSGLPFSMEHRQVKPSSRLKPFFVAEMEDDARFTTFQRQLSEMSDSKVSSVPDSDSASSLAAQEHEELLEQEDDLLSPTDDYAEPTEQEIRSTEEVHSADADPKPSGVNVGYESEIYLSTSFAPEHAHQSADASRAVELENRGEELDSSLSDAVKLETIVDKYDDSISSSLKADGKSFKLGIYEESINMESAEDDSLEGSTDAMHLIPADSLFTTEERVLDSQLTDPVYDLSPSSIKKSHSNISNYDEALLDAGEGCVHSGSPLVSNFQADELDSTLMLLEKNTSFDVNESVPYEGGETKEATTYSDTMVLLDQLISSASQEAHPLAEKFGIDPSSESRIAESQMGSVLNLPSIPEENLEDFKLEDEHEIEGIDEGLLSELDAVGDFQVEEVKSGRDSVSSLIYPAMLDFPTQLDVSQERSSNDARLQSETNLINLDDPSSVDDLPYAMESDVGSSSWPLEIDPEMTVYNPKLHILEASSFEELDSVFKRLREEAVTPADPEPNIETNSELQIPEEDIDSSVFPDVDEPPKSVSRELPLEHVVVAQTLDETDLALEQLTETPLGSSMVVASERHLEPGVLEVQSAEEIRLAFEAAIARESGSSHGQDGEESHGVGMVAGDSSSGASSLEHLTETPLGSGMDVASERHLEPGVLEVQSTEEIRFAFEAAIARETGTSHGLGGEESHGVGMVAGDSSSGASILSMKQKKDKSAKTDSSSSSSSSSSDSE